jgi:uncharacterized protein YfbU (UPF0304 family)
VWSEKWLRSAVVPNEKLTRVERTLLRNQYAILEKLDPENADRYARLRQVVERGYTIFYSEALVDEGELSAEDCRYVMDVLDMFRKDEIQSIIVPLTVSKTVGS